MILEHVLERSFILDDLLVYYVSKPNLQEILFELFPLADLGDETQAKQPKGLIVDLHRKISGNLH